MREQHLDFLAILSGLLVSRRCCKLAGFITSPLMDATGDIAKGHVGAATGFHRAWRAVELAGAVLYGVFLRDV